MSNKDRDAFDLGDFDEFGEPFQGEELEAPSGATPGGGRRNTMFVILLLGLVVVILIGVAVIILAAVQQNQTNAELERTADFIKTNNAIVQENMQRTIIAKSFTPTPSATPTPTFTETPTPTPTPTETETPSPSATFDEAATATASAINATIISLTLKPSDLTATAVAQQATNAASTLTAQPGATTPPPIPVTLPFGTGGPVVGIPPQIIVVLVTNTPPRTGTLPKVTPGKGTALPRTGLIDEVAGGAVRPDNLAVVGLAAVGLVAVIVVARRMRIRR